MVNLWPPFWFTGIQYTYISNDVRKINVRMALRFYNKNVIGIHYGGNLFSMTDPIYMMMLMRNLGKHHHIIDQAASIEFIKPGRQAVCVSCELLQDDIDDIIEHTRSGEKYLKNFSMNIVDEKTNEIIAAVKRVVYIRKKSLPQ